MKQQAMYKEYSRYYDLIYSNRDYKTLAKYIKKIIKKNKKTKGKEFLEVACGTGKYLEYFKKDFNCTGLDINKDMLKIAKKKFPRIKFVKGNMISFNLNKKFDVVACLFSSIGYVKTYSNLKKTIRTFFKHLKPGGVLIIEPWFNKSNYRIGNLDLTIHEGKDVKIVRMNLSKRKDNLSLIDFNYLIFEKAKGVRYLKERHELGLFENNETLRIMKEAGLKSKYLKKGRGFFVGVKK